MTKSIKLLAVFTAFAAGATAFAQQVPASSSASLLGQRYAQASFGYLDINKSPVDAFAAGIGVNLPLTTSLDVGLSYARAWVESNSDINSDVVNSSATFIHTAANFKTFTTLSLGYAWGFLDDRAIWGARAGAEFPINPVATVAVSAGYDDDFKSGNNGAWDGTLRGNYRLNDKITVVASFSWLEGGDVGYTLGAALRF